MKIEEQDLAIPSTMQAPVTILCTEDQLSAMLYVMAMGVTVLADVQSVPREALPEQYQAGYDQAVKSFNLVAHIGSALGQGMMQAKETPDRVQIHRITQLDPNAPNIDYARVNEAFVSNASFDPLPEPELPLDDPNAAIERHYSRNASEVAEGYIDPDNGQYVGPSNSSPNPHIEYPRGGDMFDEPEDGPICGDRGESV